ncbi:protein SSUH2 homolog [Glandiceps talaboti]
MASTQGHPYPPPQQGYPPQQQGYPPPQQGYPPPQQGYPPQQQGYPPPQQGYAPQQQGYPPPQQGYPPPQQGNPPQQQGYPPPQQGYPPPQQGYPPPQQMQPNANGAGNPPQQQMAAPQQTQAAPLPNQVTQNNEGQGWQPNQNAGENGPSYKWDNVPDTDPDSDAESVADEVGKVDVSDMAKVEGYEHVGVDVGQPIPPPVYIPPGEEEKPEEKYGEGGTISEEEAKEAMLAFVAEHCCYGSRPAKQMTIKTILPGSALHYELETYTEQRYTNRVYQPYYGGPVDGPMNGIPPGPWQIDIQPSQLFSDHTKLAEVPHTSSLRDCHRCYARGFIRCGRCYGRGRVRCSGCRGSGRRNKRVKRGDHYTTIRVSCSSCHGSGRKRCYRCGGDGRVTCPTCKGCCTLRWFIQLTVNFKNHLSDYILEKSDMPDELIRDVSGVILFEQTLLAVWPISCYPVPEINQNSLALVTQHRNAWNDQRKLQQRQRLRAVSVSEVHYNWKDVNTRYWVYGNERRVYAPDYPHQCCWGCNIL